MDYGAWKTHLHRIEIGINLDGGMIYPKSAYQIKETIGSIQIWYGNLGLGTRSNSGKMSGFPMVNSKEGMKEYIITLILKTRLLVISEVGLHKGGSGNLTGEENGLSGKELC